jgi:hypothetical protein
MKEKRGYDLYRGRKGKNNSSCGGYEYIIGSHLGDSEREEAQVKG